MMKNSPNQSRLMSFKSLTAIVSTVGGASVVDRIGQENDWQNCSTDGTLTFGGVNLPAGTFTITVHYVFGLNNSDPARDARLRLDPAGSGNNIDLWHNYPRTTSCCQQWTTPSFTVSAGAFAIWFTNPGTDDPNDRAPALDRIVIQQQ